jgi:hypothetical protein
VRGAAAHVRVASVIRPDATAATLAKEDAWVLRGVNRKGRKRG